MTRQVPPQILAIALSLAVLFTAAGCTGVSDYVRNGFRVGPEYRRPAALIADDWIDSADARLEAGPANSRNWWSVFEDSTLDRLIALAYRQNMSLREAGFRVVEAREQRAVVAGNVCPQMQELLGDFTQTQRSANTAAFRRSSSQIESGNVGLREFSNWRLGAGLAWELDFWGRFRRAVEAADAAGQFRRGL